MKEKLGSIFATVLGLALLVYCGARSLDFVSLTLPPERQVLAYFAVAATEGGIVAWLLSYLYGSNGSWQRAISMIMIGVDFIGSALLFTADTLYNTGRAGMTSTLDANSIQLIVLAMSLLIALNVGATLLHHMTEPELLRRQAEEEAHAKIADETLKQLSQKVPALAAEVATKAAAAWVENAKAEYSFRISKSTGKQQQPVITKIAEPDLPVVATESVEATTTTDELPVNPTRPPRRPKSS